MNKDSDARKLDQLKGERKRRGGQLTDDDITEARGDLQKLMGRIREKSGDQQQEIEKWFSSRNINF